MRQTADSSFSPASDFRGTGKKDEAEWDVCSGRKEMISLQFHQDGVLNRVLLKAPPYELDSLEKRLLQEGEFSLSIAIENNKKTHRRIVTIGKFQKEIPDIDR
jgi:hypothetical protein